MEDIKSIAQHRKDGKKAGDIIKENFKAILKQGWIFEKPLEKVILLSLMVLGGIKFIEIIT